MPPRRKKGGGRKGAVRKSGSASGFNWLTFIGGFAVGVVLTFGGLYLYTADLQMNFGAGIRNLIKNRTIENSSNNVSSPTPKSEDPKPVFDFYTVLPEYETVVNEKQFIRETPASKKSNSTTSYILQAASYKSFKDADKLKAKLALNGLSSSIEKISVEGKGSFYRVRLGPYTSTNTKKDVVRRLGELGIKPLHLKVEN